LVSLWSSIDTSRIPRAIIVFLNRRKSEFGLKRVLLADKSTEIRLWNCFPRTLSEGASDPLIVAYQYPPPPLPREDSFTALWRLASLRLDYHFFDSDNLQLMSIESLLEALSTTESRFAHISHSIIALLKFQILQTIKSGSYRTLEEARLNHCVFPAETAIDIPDIDEVLDELEPSDEPWAFYNFKHNRISEASIYVVAEYLEHCNSDILPYNTAKTLEKFTYYPPNSAIHHTHQLRLANSVHAVFRAAPSAELLNAILNCSCWSLYAQGPKTEDQVRAYREKIESGRPVLELWPWLDHPIARQKIEHTFEEYENQLITDPLELATLTQLQNILQGLKSWHESDSMNPDGDEENEGSISDSIGGRMVRRDASASSSTEAVP
jgi:hypothetical protein